MNYGYYFREARDEFIRNDKYSEIPIELFKITGSRFVLPFHILQPYLQQFSQLV